jgi:4-alpha-glucanotransferase
VLARWGLWRYLVMLFEREHDGHFRPPEWYPAEGLATFSTHDLPSLRGWLEAHDLRIKRGIGFDPGESDDARSWAQQCLRQILGERAPDRVGDELGAVASILAQTPSRLVAIALDDILGEREQINIPGTTEQHPNWRRKLPVDLEDLGGNEQLRRVAEVFAKSGRSWR